MILLKNISLTLLMLFFGTQFVSAQIIDHQNKVEYAEELEEDNLNPIKLIKAVTKTKKKNSVTSKKKEDTEITIEDLQRMAERRSSLRYRRQRSTPKKCYKEEESPCKIEKK